MSLLGLHVVFAASLFNMFSHPFMRHAFLASTFIAPACGLVGYFVVLRNQVFAGDALSHVAFTGSLAALAFGVNQRFGLFASTIAVAVLLGILGSRRQLNDVVIGITFAWLLGLGSFFLSLFTRNHSTGNSTAGPNVLFGSIFGINGHQAWMAVFVSVGVMAVLLMFGRRLLFASIDISVAAAQGVSTRGIGVLFLLLVGVQVAETVQVVGALLLLGLLATPAAAASRLTSRPYRAMWLSAVFCLGVVWFGLTLSYLVPKLPPSFVIIATAFAIYVGSTIISRKRQSIV